MTCKILKITAGAAAATASTLGSHTFPWIEGCSYDVQPTVQNANGVQLRPEGEQHLHPFNGQVLDPEVLRAEKRQPKEGECTVTGWLNDRKPKERSAYAVAFEELQARTQRVNPADGDWTVDTFSAGDRVTIGKPGEDTCAGTITSDLLTSSRVVYNTHRFVYDVDVDLDTNTIIPSFATCPGVVCEERSGGMTVRNVPVERIALISRGTAEISHEAILRRLASSSISYVKPKPAAAVKQIEDPLNGGNAQAPPEPDFREFENIEMSDDIRAQVEAWIENREDEENNRPENLRTRISELQEELQRALEANEKLQRALTEKEEENEKLRSKKKSWFFRS